MLAFANHYCEYTFPANSNVTRIGGKMNVPIKPAVEPGKVLFLWPGVNPYGGEGGMMQPVLTYGADYGQGSGVWGMANWFTNCDNKGGYCHDPYHPVQEGDTLAFEMEYKSTFAANASHLWEMRWSALNGGQSSSFLVYRELDAPLVLWGTEAEFYLNSSDPANYGKLPRSPFAVWDLYAERGADGARLPLSWTAHGNAGAADIVANCSWTAGGVSDALLLTMPGAGAACSPGYSRAYDAGCNDYCGCTNKQDGSQKLLCDYCCSDDGAACRRENGPSGTPLLPAWRRAAVDTSSLPAPGLVAHRPRPGLA